MAKSSCSLLLPPKRPRGRHRPGPALQPARPAGLVHPGLKDAGQMCIRDSTPTEQYFAKGCYGVQGLLKLPRLDDGVPNDFLSRLFERARETIRQEAEAHRGEQEAYEAAMEQARELIEGIHDPATALETAHQLKKLSHYLTSEREAKALLAAKIKALGMHWDREAGAYVKE